jgi:hypothetical protein
MSTWVRIRPALVLPTSWPSWWCSRRLRRRRLRSRSCSARGLFVAGVGVLEVVRLAAMWLPPRVAVGRVVRTTSQRALQYARCRVRPIRRLLIGIATCACCGTCSTPALGMSGDGHVRLAGVPRRRLQQRLHLDVRRVDRFARLERFSAPTQPIAHRLVRLAFRSCIAHGRRKHLLRLSQMRRRRTLR